MPFTADDARRLQNANQKAAELAQNESLIEGVARSGGRWVQVHFDASGREHMAGELRARGFQVEFTHGERGLKASW